MVVILCFSSSLSSSPFFYGSFFSFSPSSSPPLPNGVPCPTIPTTLTLKSTWINMHSTTLAYWNVEGKYETSTYRAGQDHTLARTLRIQLEGDFNTLLYAPRLSSWSDHVVLYCSVCKFQQVMDKAISISNVFVYHPNNCKNTYQS